MSADNVVKKLRNPEVFDVGSTSVACGFGGMDTTLDEAADLIERQQRQIAAYKELALKTSKWFVNDPQIIKRIAEIEAME